jgi:hypothetical protein
MMGRPVDRALMEACPNDKDGHDACYALKLV